MSAVHEFRILDTSLDADPWDVHCETCNESLGRFIQWPTLGMFCEDCAETCCGCSRRGVPFEQASLCTECMASGRWEWSEAADGTWGWFRRDVDDARRDQAETLLGLRWTEPECVIHGKGGCDMQGDFCGAYSDLEAS